MDKLIAEATSLMFNVEAHLVEARTEHEKAGVAAKEAMRGLNATRISDPGYDEAEAEADRLYEYRGECARQVSALENARQSALNTVNSLKYAVDKTHRY